MRHAQSDQESILSLAATHGTNHERLDVVVCRREATHAVMPYPVVAPHETRRVVPHGERVHDLLAEGHSAAPVAFCQSE